MTKQTERPPPVASGSWEHFAHAADLGVRGIGSSLADAFAQIATATIAAVTDPKGVRPEVPVEISCTAEALDDLLYDWLNRLVYEMAIRGMLFSRFAVQIGDGTLDAVAWGERVSPKRHRPAVEVKGATYTGLRVVALPGGDWLAECVIDV